MTSKYVEIEMNDEELIVYCNKNRLSIRNICPGMCVLVDSVYDDAVGDVEIVDDEVVSITILSAYSGYLYLERTNNDN